MTTAHEVLVKNAKRALENLSKDNSVSLPEVLSSLEELKGYIEDLLWDVEEEVDQEWVDTPEGYKEMKYDFDDGSYK